jgi:hypothetical protein
MQLKRYVAPGRAARPTPRAVTIEPGSVNHHGQLVVRKAGRAADDLPGQNLYLLKCNRCGHEYAEAGIRVHGRKCPTCSGGKPGVRVPESQQANLFE